MKKRLYEIDLLCSIMILILPLIYMFLIFNNYNLLSISSRNILESIFNIFTIVLAPIFIIYVGIDINNSKESSYKELIIKGFKILLIEVILNILRYIIPGLISYFATNKVNQKIILDIIISKQFTSNILTLIGLIYIAFGIFKKFKLNPLKVTIICIFLSILGEIISLYITSSNIVLNGYLSNILGNFVWISESSTYPLIEWLIFASIGCLIGYLLDKYEDDVIWNNGFIISFLIFLSTIFILFILGKDIFVSINSTLNINHMDLFSTLAQMSFSFIILFLIKRLHSIFHFNKIKKIVKFLTENLLVYYSICSIIINSIMLVSCSLGLWNTLIFSNFQIIILYIIILISSYICSKVLNDLYK